MQKNGLFIAFEGIDGCGKSTQFMNLAEYLFKYNKKVNLVLTREPYKDINIRKLLHEDADALSKAALFTQLFTEDRANHVAELITPEIEQGKHVLTDRYKYSTIAYQAAQGLPMSELIHSQQRFPVPDIIVVIDLPATVAAARMQDDARVKHFLEKDISFLEKVRQNFLA
ncbi:MAG: dTMP kinase, partial [Nanoarchaeota archaeon]